tara:strand:- start:1862 stop:2818 length:957 start_codon:yes stop_codon:yes gene_type:complete
MKIGIIGCGLIGSKRALCYPEKVKSVYDINPKLALALSKEINCIAAESLEEILNDKDIKYLIIAVPHNMLFEIAKKGIKHNKNLLIEKPGCISLDEAKELQQLQAKNKDLRIHIGFNHRFHPSFIEIKKELKNSDYGQLMFIRGRYGHGGRLGYEKEWRANKSISGGGELIDQGSHLIDLSLVFDKKFNLNSCVLDTFFWNMEVEDNAFVCLKSKKATSWLHASWTEWKNLFSFEIYYEKAKFHVEGLGGSYGEEKLTKYFMSDKMGIPEIKIHNYNQTDLSWKVELDCLLAENNTYIEPCQINDLVKIWTIIEETKK